MSINIRCTLSSEGEIINSYTDSGYNLDNREVKNIRLIPGSIHTKTIINQTFRRNLVLDEISGIAKMAISE